jgi:hypothetical protein
MKILQNFVAFSEYMNFNKGFDKVPIASEMNDAVDSFPK